MNLTIKHLAHAHIERQKEWDPENEISLLFRATEMAGEVGEACNVIKKLERQRLGLKGSRSSKEALGEELADVIHTAMLTALTAEIDIEACLIDKFNKASEANGLDTRLPD